MRTPRSAVQPPLAGVLWSGLGYFVVAAVLALSSVLRASLSGEISPYEPTAAEIATWGWGQGLFFVGAALLVAWSVAVVMLRRRLRLSGSATTYVVVAGFVFCVAVTVITWFIVLPPQVTA